MSGAVDVRDVIRRFDCAHHTTLAAYPASAECDAALMAFNELIEAAHRAEVSFNTVRGCYERNPGNFAHAIRELEADVIPLRAALANCGGGK